MNKQLAFETSIIVLETDFAVVVVIDRVDVDVDVDGFGVNVGARVLLITSLVIAIVDVSEPAIVPTDVIDVSTVVVVLAVVVV